MPTESSTESFITFESSRRQALRLLLSGGILATPISLLAGTGKASPPPRGTGSPRGIGALQAADANGVRLPPGFSSRIVAQSGQLVVAGSPYLWHRAPDGGATFASGDGGWIYVSNSEVTLNDGGAGAIRFSAEGSVIDAYSILTGTNINCAGGPTPWNTWLSCEEYLLGEVWECDPFGVEPGRKRSAMGTFQHEAVAVDPLGQRLYLTEDNPNGRLYRFTPDVYPDLGSGLLECAEVIPGSPDTLIWHTVPNPNPNLLETPTREQIAQSTAFNGGEGIWYFDGKVYFTTKGDNRVWSIDLTADSIEVIYDAATSANPILTGVDNITVAGSGDLYVAEDGGDLQLVVIDRNNNLFPIAQLEGHAGSEITGPAFSPDGSRLYFSSQRGAANGSSGSGVTFEISGPFPAEDEIFADNFES